MVEKQKRKTSDTHAVISVTKDVGDVLQELKGGFSYAGIIKYLLIRCGYMQVSGEDEREYKAMCRYIDGND